MATAFLSNIAWDFVWQRHQTLASFFAQHDDVIFVEIPGVRGVRWTDMPRVVARLRRLASNGLPAAADPVPPRVTIVRPFVLPATNAVYCATNALLIRRFLARQPALAGELDTVVNYSTWRTARQLLSRLRYRKLVYDCTDDLLAVKGAPATAAEDERFILANADLTLVPSRRLEEMKRPLARRLVRMPHGAMVDRFIVPPKPRAEDARVTALYYGHLHPQHLDFAALDALAHARPDWRVILVGPSHIQRSFPPNVEVAGQVRHNELARWIEQADVLLLPYVLNEYTRSVMPAKTYECLATGRPIVAAPLPELVNGFAEQLTFAQRPDEWAAVIEVALRSDTEEKRSARIEQAKQNSWAKRYAEIRRLLTD